MRIIVFLLLLGLMVSAPARGEDGAALDAARKAAWAKVDAGDPAAAARDLAGAIASARGAPAPARGNAYAALGEIYLEADNPQPAIKAFNDALDALAETAPEEPHALVPYILMGRGRAHMRLEQLYPALSDFRRAGQAAARTDGRVSAVRAQTFYYAAWPLDVAGSLEAAAYNVFMAAKLAHAAGAEQAVLDPYLAQYKDLLTRLERDPAAATLEAIAAAPDAEGAYLELFDAVDELEKAGRKDAAVRRLQETRRRLAPYAYAGVYTVMALVRESGLYHYTEEAAQRAKVLSEAAELEKIIWRSPSGVPAHLLEIEAAEAAVLAKDTARYARHAASLKTLQLPEDLAERRAALLELVAAGASGAACPVRVRESLAERTALHAKILSDHAFERGDLVGSAALGRCGLDMLSRVEASGKDPFGVIAALRIDIGVKSAQAGDFALTAELLKSLDEILGRPDGERPGDELVSNAFVFLAMAQTMEQDYSGALVSVARSEELGGRGDRSLRLSRALVRTTAHDILGDQSASRAAFADALALASRGADMAALEPFARRLAALGRARDAAAILKGDAAAPIPQGAAGYAEVSARLFRIRLKSSLGDRAGARAEAQALAGPLRAFIAQTTPQAKVYGLMSANLALLLSEASDAYLRVGALEAAQDFAEAAASLAAGREGDNFVLVRAQTQAALARARTVNGEAQQALASLNQAVAAIGESAVAEPVRFTLHSARAQVAAVAGDTATALGDYRLVTAHLRERLDALSANGEDGETMKTLARPAFEGLIHAAFAAGAN